MADSFREVDPNLKQVCARSLRPLADIYSTGTVYQFNLESQHSSTPPSTPGLSCNETNRRKQQPEHFPRRDLSNLTRHARLQRVMHRRYLFPPSIENPGSSSSDLGFDLFSISQLLRMRESWQANSGFEFGVSYGQRNYRCLTASLFFDTRGYAGTNVSAWVFSFLYGISI